MRWLALVALVGCRSTVTTANRDADNDSTDGPDARFGDARLVDAYAPGACDAPAMFAAGLAPTRIVHVKAGAVGGDGSSTAPFGSIAAAAAVATPGTFIQLGAGTHAANQFIPNLRGTAAAPIWIGGEWGTRPRINGGAEGIHLTRPAYVVIQNLEILAQTANAITIDDGVAHATDTESIAIVNVYAHDGGAGACFKVSGVNGLAIYDSAAERCLYGVDMIGVHGGVVARSVFDTTNMRGIVARGGSTDIDIRQNRLLDGGMQPISLGGVTAPSQFRPALSATTDNAEALRVRAFNNYIVGDFGAAFELNGCTDCLVAHNFVAGTPRTLLRLVQETTATGFSFAPTRDVRVINNSLTWMPPISSFVETDSNLEVSTLTFSHNLWQGVPLLPVTEDGQVVSFSAYSPAGSGQYCGGPEAGAAAPLPEIDGTFDGDCRSAGEAPTIGPGMLQTAGCGI